MRAAIYVRISEDKVGAGLGVKRQEKDCRALVERLGWHVHDVYVDNDRSAYSGRPRRQYERMLDDIRAGTVDAVVAWHTDRLHRSPVELEDYITVCQASDVPTHTVKAGLIDLSTPSGRAVARTLGAWARYGSEHKAERIKAKHVELAAAGKATGGGHRPFGYRRVYDRPERPHKLVREEVIPAEAEIVREGARRVLAGEALIAVARDLNDRGVTTSAGKDWSTTSLARLLCSARIAGQREHRPRSRGDTSRVVIGEITGKAAWPAIITTAQSTRLRAMLSDPRRRTSPGPTGRYLAAGGVLYCGKCEQRMVGRSRGKGGAWLYMCDGAPGRPGCGKLYIDGAGVDEVVTGWVAGALGDPDFRAALERRDASPDDEELLGEIASCEDELAQLAGDKGRGLITRNEWFAAREPVLGRLNRAQTLLEHADTTRVLAGVPDGADAVRAYLNDPDVPVSRRRAVIHVVLVRVTVAAAVPGRAVFDPDRLTPTWRA